MTDYLTALFELPEAQAEEDTVSALVLHTKAVLPPIKSELLGELGPSEGRPPSHLSTPGTSYVESFLDALPQIRPLPAKLGEGGEGGSPSMALPHQLIEVRRQAAAIAAPGGRPGELPHPLSHEPQRVGVHPLPSVQRPGDGHRLPQGQPPSNLPAFLDAPAHPSAAHWLEGGPAQVEGSVGRAAVPPFAPPLSPELVDRAFQRDSRRYDRGFALY